MENNNYEIYYKDGLKPGVSKEEAAEKLAQLLKIPLPKAVIMIESTDRVVKSGLSKDQAVKYYSALSRVGLLVKIRETKQQEEMDGEVTEQTVPNLTPDTPPVVEPVVRKTNYDHALDVKHPIQLVFNGSGFEYFKIWIVNIFLTILTLGIYSAWAKVRNKQYFYGNTLIDGNSFNYTAKPIAILKGRLIAVGFFVVYAVIYQFAPLMGFILFLILMAFLPWIIIRSLAFNARNSVFRNIRFNFNAKVGDAVKVFLAWPILIIPTLGLILPLIWFKQSQFMINNSSYGTTPFEFHAKVRDYFKIFFIFLGVILLMGIIMSVLVAALGINPANPGSQEMTMAIMLPFSLLIYLFMFAYLAAKLGNLYFNSTTLAKHGFSATMQIRKIGWIYFSNTLAIVLSLGLLIPWAQVRMTNYRVSCLQLNVVDSLDDFIAAEEQHVSALGEQVGEVFDMDVSVI
ncbi:MAG: DUF898 domain-containing protein [Gammaproteobacteria bacterium]|jgi:uncharacterized membrane protein YjgN (DUF898 family)|nr:DUF898 domain-containing protein [Gammaproteobacteria bacterium]MBT3724573.1 DUF898 domain-containing protein [Gammaproteobacteria bacterium]MBT4077106.1 DUF898 domain-containing protein [Gammaproteobacteria bacterium]MBT4195218.1 DUF898 domain-containing protein [Gammaproteobacteria bacterium]MBT4448554.1 DUF898 domain-containing protein [Gammaproteobacteria bacterium]